MEQPKFEGTPLPVETRGGIEVYKKPSGYYWRKAGNPLMHGTKDGGYETLEDAFVAGSAELSRLAEREDELQRDGVTYQRGETTERGTPLVTVGFSQADRERGLGQPLNRDDVERTTTVSPVTTGDGYEVWEAGDHTFCWCLPWQEGDWLGHDEFSFGGGFADVEAAARDAERILRIVRKVTEAAAAATELREAIPVAPVEPRAATIDLSMECDVVGLGPIDPDNCIVVRLRSGTGFEQAKLASEVMANRFPGLKYAIVAGEVDFFRVGKVDAPARAPQQPSVGRVVHYVNGTKHLAAIITRVCTDLTGRITGVDLFTCPTIEAPFAQDNICTEVTEHHPVDGAAVNHTWHWPERVG